MIMGYTDKLSVRAEDRIRFMVSTEAKNYRADLVRLVHGDTNPQGPGFKEEVLVAPFSGEYAGKNQPLHPGSYISVDAKPALKIGNNFSFVTWIFPTKLNSGKQMIVSNWSSQQQSGFQLYVNDDCYLSVQLGRDSHPSVTLIMPELLLENRWQFVGFTYNALSKKVTVFRKLPANDFTSVVQDSLSVQVDSVNLSADQCPLILAASVEHKKLVKNCFNGKISAPRLFANVLNEETIENLRRNVAVGVSEQDHLIAEWDFSKHMSSDVIADISGNGLHGVAVNMPMRAVTGPIWLGYEDNYAQIPDQYNAIHFHEDDLEDAGWDACFEFDIPSELNSGIYAVRLVAGGEEDYLPFFVCPEKGTSNADIAFLIPTFSYLAYSNEGVSTPGLQSLYSEHSDGSGVEYASLMKPLINIRPKSGNLRSVEGNLFARHLSADLYFVDWLESRGIAYDIITDHELAEEGKTLLESYKVVATGSHPEYVSETILDGLQGYLSGGGRVTYFGGNGFYWVTSQFSEKPHVIEVRRANGSRPWMSEPGEYYHASTGEMGGLWRFRGRPPNQLVGVGFSAQGWRSDDACGLNSSYVRQPGSFDSRVSFIFDGVSREEVIADFPSLGLGVGAAGDEIDRLDYSLGSPAHTLILATASDFTDDYQYVIEERNGVNESSTVPGHEKVRADMVYFECPNNGAVFSVGSISWFSCLSYNNYQNNVSTITGNVLKAFSTGKLA